MGDFPSPALALSRAPRFLKAAWILASKPIMLWQRGPYQFFADINYDSIIHREKTGHPSPFSVSLARDCYDTRLGSVLTFRKTRRAAVGVDAAVSVPCSLAVARASDHEPYAVS